MFIASGLNTDCTLSKELLFILCCCLYNRQDTEQTTHLEPRLMVP